MLPTVTLVQADCGCGVYLNDDLEIVKDEITIQDMIDFEVDKKLHKCDHCVESIDVREIVDTSPFNFPKSLERLKQMYGLK